MRLPHAHGITLLAAVAVTLGAGRDARSQSPGLTVTGVVRSLRDSAGIAGAIVSFPDVHSSARTDSTGRFQLEDIPATTLRITVTRLGHAPIDSVVEIFSTPMRLWMRPSAQELDPVSVSAKGRGDLPVSATLTEFEQRRKAGRGRFITAAELRKEDERGIIEVLRSHLTGVAFEYAQDGVHAYSPSQQPPQALLRKSTTNCHTQVVIDGVSVYQQEGVGGTSAPPNLAELMIRNLDGIEYYSNPSQTPPEFRTTGAACGTLVIWSRRK